MSTRRTVTRRAIPLVGLTGALVVGALTVSGASSHREAPMSSQDPVSDLTDVYAFVSPDRADTVTLIANVIPFEEPAGGPNFFRFGDDVLYEINVDTDGDAVADMSYEFNFATATGTPNTFLYNTNQVTSYEDPDLNIKQFYSVTEVDRNGRRPVRRVLGQFLPVPPANVGPRSTPDYEKNLGAPAVKDIDGGIKSFAGPRDDPFFVDLGSIFDLGGLRPLNAAHLIPLPTEAGEDYLAGYNVHTLALQIPTTRLLEGDPVIGVWASTYRRSTRVLNGFGGQSARGNWVQVSRLGMPLVNEVVMPLGVKDVFNASKPSTDLAYGFGQYVVNPELGKLIPVLYPGVTVPDQVGAGLGTGGREDLATIFLTGIPGVNQPANVVPSEMIRLNTSVATSGFPNGRLLADDVTDIELQAIAGATAFTPAFNKAPNNQIGDGVNANDVPFLGTFPYVATPHSGY